MSNRALNWARGQTVGHQPSKHLLTILADYADERDSCFPSQETLARETELSLRAVVSALQRLEAAGLIRRFRHRRRDGTLGLTRYYLAVRGRFGADGEEAAEPVDNAPPDAPRARGDHVHLTSQPRAPHVMTTCTRCTSEPSGEPSREPRERERARTGASAGDVHAGDAQGGGADVSVADIGAAPDGTGNAGTGDPPIEAPPAGAPPAGAPPAGAPPKGAADVSDTDIADANVDATDTGLSSDGRSVEDFRDAWVTSAQDDSERVDAAWDALSGEERTAALDHVAAFLEDARAFGRGRICAGATYLRQKRWRRLAGQSGSGRAKARRSGAGGRRSLRAFSREWWLVAVRRAQAVRSPSDTAARRLRFMVQVALNGTGIAVEAAEEPSPAAVEAAVSIPWDGEAFEAWAHWFGACGVEVPRRDSGWVWVPSPWPPGYGPGTAQADGLAGDGLAQDGLANGIG